MHTSVQELYGELWAGDDPAFAEKVNRSLQPRRPDCLYDLFGLLGIEADELVLDVGCRDAGYAVELVKRFGCRVRAVDLIPLHVDQGRRRVAEAGLSDHITVEVGRIEALPLADASIDRIWCRDMLNHVDLAAGLTECARVLPPGREMFVYQTFATPLLEPLEAARLYGALAIVPGNMIPATFEDGAERAGFHVIQRDMIDSEWREGSLQRREGEMVEDLIRLSRMRRQEEELVRRFGRKRYEAAYGAAAWGIYQILGKLCPTVYVLRRG